MATVKNGRGPCDGEASMPKPPTARLAVCLAALLAVALPVPVAAGTPHAAFFVSTDETYPNRSVTFTDDSSSPDSTLLQWRWTFGDGLGSSQRSPIHAYANPGYYTVTLTVTDNHGDTSTAQRQIYVRFAPNTPGTSQPAPTVDPDAGPDRQAMAGDTVLLNGTNRANGSPNVQWLWRQTSGVQVALRNATAPQASFVAPDPGAAVELRLTFVLRLTDGSAFAEDTVNVTVRAPPTRLYVYAGGDLSAPRGERVILNGSASHGAPGAVLRYTWRQVGGPRVDLTGADTPMPSFVVPADADAPLEFQLDVSDGTTIRSDSARVFPTAPRTPTAGMDVVVIGRSVVVASLVAGRNHTWDFGDGRNATGRTATHLYPRDGNYTVTLRLVDTTGHAHQYSKNVTIATPPTPTPRASPGPAAWLLPLALLAVASLAAARLRRR
jgi:PKD repeat protein